MFFIFWKKAAVAALFGIAWILCSSIAATPQDRYVGLDGELIPPLRLTEEDFTEGFHKTFKFPCENPDYRGGHDNCEGTISLSYTPGELAPIDAVIYFKQTYDCSDAGGNPRECNYSVSWSGELEPVDDDPEGIFPARRYNQFGPETKPVMSNNDPVCKLVPGSPQVFVDIILMQELEDTIDRTTFIDMRFETDLKCWDPAFKRWDDGAWSSWWTCGPPWGEPEEEKDLELEGCADLLVGGEEQLDASGKSEGGEHEWSTDDSSVMTVSGSGSSATISGKSPGRTVVRVEYENEDGETIKVEKSGSVVELRSVNNGAAVPKIPLIDENGKTLPPIEVPVDQDPGEGDLLTFAVADPGVATVLNLGSTLQIQGIRKGATTARAQTNCGEKTGPVINLEVVYCNEETVQKLRDEMRMIKARLDSGRQQMAELTGDEEFERASKEGPEDIKDLAQSTAELISATLGAAGKVSKAVNVSKGAETADNLYSMISTFNNFATGMAEGNIDKVGEATFDATVQLLELTVVGVAKTAYAAGTAASKVGRDLGALFGTADRIKELEEVTKETYRELEDVNRRLYEVCLEKSAAKKEPSPSPEPAPSAKPSPAPEPPPAPEPTAPTPEPSQDQGQGPSSTEDDGTTKTGEGEPPVTPPAKEGGAGSGGLSMDCGCDNWEDYNNDMAKLAKYMNITVQCVDNFESNLLPGFQDDLDVLSSALKGLTGAGSLPEEEKKTRFREYLNNTNGMLERIEEFTEEAEAFRSSIEGCDKASKQAVEMMNNTADETIEGIKSE